MVKQALGYILALFFLPAFSSAQGLIFCLDHTKEGAALAPDSLFELDQFGQEIDFLFQNYTPIEASVLYFFIDKEVGGEYVEFDTKSLVPDSGRAWAALSYRFERSGRYRVLVLDGEKKEVCRGGLKVNVLRDVGGPSYFQDADVVFCHRVLGGEPDMDLDHLSLGTPKRRDIAVLLKHYRPLRFRRLVMDVWKMGPEDELVYVETMEFDIQPHWMYTQFEYTFRDRGEYEFKAYTEDEVWVATGRIEVVR